MKTTRFIISGLTILMFCLGSMLSYAEEPVPPEEEFFKRELLSEEEILEWLKQYVPQGVSELEAIKREEPRFYEERLFDLAHRIEHLEHVKQENPEMFKRLIKADNLEVESWKIAKQIGQTQDEETRKQLTAKLKSILEEIFEIRLEERTLEIQMLEKELKEMKTLIEKRQAMKDKIIERRLKEMIPPEEGGLEWW